jgi:hypothetical protein
VKTGCPNCGAEIEFRYDDSFVRVCGHCRAAVVRGDRGIETLGRVADLAPLESPLHLFVEGRLRGLGFMIIGRAQIRHGAGGVWQEWYGKFDDGRWGWIAEAQGRVYATFEAAGAGDVPPWPQLVPGQPVGLHDEGWRSFVVAERGEAQYLAAEGEIPYRFVPGASFLFADLSDGAGRFATLDYGDAANEPPTIYLGREVTYAELGLVGAGAAMPMQAARIASRHLACPNCGGSIELRAPDRTQRVACPFCDTFLDATQGDLRVITRLGAARGTPKIPLGTRGRFEDHELTVIGFVRREAILHGRWPFDEYLLYHPALGFRWLVESDGHWSYVKPLEVGAVVDRGDQAVYGDVAFRRFQTCPVEVVAVFGELYWQVVVGETVHATDWVAPPAMLSKEESSDEVVYSLGEYLTPDDVKARLGLAELPGSPVGIAPNQPFKHRGTLGMFGLLALAAAATAAVLGIVSHNRVVYTEGFGVPDPGGGNLFQLPSAEAAAQGQVFFTQPFQLEAHQNVAIELTTSVDNSWMFVAGDLVNDATGQLEAFERPIERYHGVEGGESWSEGSSSTTVHVGAVDAGTYLVRLEVQRDPQPQPGGSIGLRVTVRQDVFRGGHLLAVLLAIGIPGLIFLLWHWSFERRRWRDSDEAPWHLRRGDSDDDD